MTNMPFKAGACLLFAKSRVQKYAVRTNLIQYFMKKEGRQDICRMS